MSGGDNLNPAQFRQLQMFATPEEVGQMHSNDMFPYRVHEVPEMLEHYDAKTRPGYLGRLRSSVEEHGGIENPIHVKTSEGGSVLIDGNHRAVVAMATNRLVPVVHHDWREDTQSIIRESSREKGPTS